jgi:hypothetical protein
MSSRHARPGICYEGSEINQVTLGDEYPWQGTGSPSYGTAANELAYFCSVLARFHLALFCSRANSSPGGSRLEDDFQLPG